LRSRQNWVKEQNLSLILPFKSISSLFFKENPFDPAKEVHRNRFEKEELKKKKILCSQCGFQLTDDTERFIFENESEYTFKNPQGYYFDIILFENANGCHTEGPFTKEFSWFHGFSWNYAYCSSCFNHLGWFFLDGKKNSFFGLIKERLEGNF